MTDTEYKLPSNHREKVEPSLAEAFAYALNQGDEGMIQEIQWYGDVVCGLGYLVVNEIYESVRGE